MCSVAYGTPTAPGDPLLRRWRGWLVVIPVISIAGFTASVRYGTPAKLPRARDQAALLIQTDLAELNHRLADVEAKVDR